MRAVTAARVGSSGAADPRAHAADPRAPAADPLALRLRRDTREAHLRLERSLDLVGHRLSTVRYTLLLERFLGFHDVLEPRLDRWHDRRGLLDWPLRRKLDLLHQDLGELGVSAAARDRLPRCPEVPAVGTTAQALGVLYVVEGATLGGRVIAVHLADTGVPARAVRFFASYGDQVGRRWHHFRAASADWVGTDPDRADAVVDSAVRTFQLLGRWLAPAAVDR